MEIDIPEMSTMDKIKYMPNKSPEALMKEDAMGNTPLSRTAAESMKI